MDGGSSETHFGAAPLHPAGIDGFAPGTVLADRYRMVALVGRGGMGEVYRADDLRLGQAIALKFLPATLEHDHAARDRLIAEVRSARTVSHPNVCRVYDVAEVRNRYFLTMEYIDGEDLASLLRRIGRLPAAKALEIGRQLCAGLAAAHERGVLHRDLKPANVMIDGRGQARITDFGLAVEVEPVAPAGRAAVPRGVVDVAGTIAYMAPERFDGRPATVQSDLYALGLVLYEICTGRQALTATTVEAWRRVHSDSTPSHPSEIVADIEPAMERAILRCLEKDPARRPASAAQLAASLPGGDPLAAAIAAGETPSPELVAASGEEGTLPRAQAWRRFLACIGMLILALPLGQAWHIENLVALDAPLLQEQKARQILQRIHYTEAPRDSMGWLEVNAEYMNSVMARAPAERFTPPAGGLAGPLVYCYREGRSLLFSWNPLGRVSTFDPAPLFDNDVYLELDPHGRLITLQAGGLNERPERAPPSAVVEPDWAPLFDAAGLDRRLFTPVVPQWIPVFPFDARAAWEGRAASQAVRVEAAAWRGRPVHFRVRLAGLGAVPAASRHGIPEPAVARPTDRVTLLLNVLFALLMFACFAAFAALARHNLRAGRGDRKGAFKLAVVVVAAEAAFVLFHRHWTWDPLNVLRVPMNSLGVPFFASLYVWLCYLALEPLVRRRWPHLLIAWTRMLDARWRDPLVGRSLLAGTTAALLASAVFPGLAVAATRLAGVPLAFPWGDTRLHAGLGWFLANSATPWVGPVQAVFIVCVLLVARLVTGRDWLAWAVLLILSFGELMWMMWYSQPWLFAAPLAAIVLAAVFTASAAIVLARHGLLAVAVFLTVQIALLNTPLTWDVSRWYFWRTGVILVLIVGIAVWGFRNVLGRQSAFPEGTLE